MILQHLVVVHQLVQCRYGCFPVIFGCFLLLNHLLIVLVALIIWAFLGLLGFSKLLSLLHDLLLSVDADSTCYGINLDDPCSFGEVVVFVGVLVVDQNV